MSFLDLNDNCVTLTGLYNKISASYVNDATVTVTITDSSGGALVTAQAMPYVAASDGIYQTVIASTDVLGDDGDKVTVEVNGTAGDGSVFQAIESVYIYNRKLKGTS